MASQVSSISQALAENSSTLRIPRPVTGQEDHASSHIDPDSETVAIKGSARATGLPTPPNSISPNLQPETFTARLAKELAASPTLSNIDSDIDLHGPEETANSRDNLARNLYSEDSSINEGVGIVTPTYLAKHHLAAMILERGPIAIRHVIDHLSRNVPGFADIPPAKARRIVVAALESRTGGGLHGEVEFEKVGWGRWDAKVKGQPSRSHRVTYSYSERPPSPPMSIASSSVPTRSLNIPGERRPRTKSRRLSHNSWAAESIFSSRSERGAPVDADVLEDEAASMSIDEENGEEQQNAHQPKRTFHARLPYRTQREQQTQPAFYSDTDEEDWSRIHPVSSSYVDMNSNKDPHLRRKSRNASNCRKSGNSTSAFSSSTNWEVPHQNRLKSHQRRPRQQLDFTGVEMDSQEKSAIEALLQMGSR